MRITNYSSFLLYFLKKQYLLFCALLLLSLSSAVSSTVWPFVLSNVVDILDQYNGDKLYIFHTNMTIFLKVMLFWVMLEGMTRSRGLLLAYLLPKFEANIRVFTYNYVINHSHSYFITNYVGTIANRIGDLPRASSLVIDIILSQFTTFFIAIVVSTYLLSTISNLLAFVLFFWLTLHITICIYFSRKATDYSRIQSEARSNLQGKIVDSISNHLSIRLFGGHKHESNYIQEVQNDEQVKYIKAMIYIEKVKIALGLLSMLGVCTLFYCTIYVWQIGNISIGNVVFVANLTINMMALVWTVSEEMTYFFREVGVCNQAIKIIKDPINIQQTAQAKPLIVSKGDISFHNVYFSYNSIDLFQGLTINIKGGTRIGLVGRSGAGKSTFVGLILRLYDPTHGAVYIDNQDIKNVTSASLHNNITLIPQEPILFHRSIIENVRYGKNDITDEEVMEACRRAQCHDSILKMENGYNTIVGELGSSLSGGQRQRIAMARSIIANAPIAILDEATSALDNITERAIQRDFFELTAGRTTIVIAHRLSTLLNVDRILVFEEGSIVEDGSHNDLIAQKGRYAQMWLQNNVVV